MARVAMEVPARAFFRALSEGVAYHEVLMRSIISEEIPPSGLPALSCADAGMTIIPAIAKIKNECFIYTIRYFVAASSFFIIENINRPDTRQSAMSTVHTPQRGSLPQSRPGIDTR